MLLTLARANRSLGNLDDGRHLADRAAAALSAHHGPDSPEFADALVELGRIVRDLALYDTAQTILETARAVYERTTTPEDPRLGIAISELASAAIYLGDLPKAKRLRGEAWQIHLEGLGPDDPQTIRTLMLYGTVLRRTGQMDSAVAVLREAVDRRRRLGSDHEVDLTEGMLQLATTLQTIPDRLDEAEQIFREALAIQRRALGPTHVAVVWPLGSLSEIAEQRGDLAEAERLLRESLDVRRHANGERHPNTAGSIGGLAAFLARHGRAAEAETQRRLSIKILTETLGPEHPRTADHMGALAELLIERRSYPEADSLLRRAIAARSAVQGGSHMDLYPLYERQALLFLSTGDHAAAERAIDNALGVMHDGVPDPFSPRLHRIAAEVYEATGRVEEAARHRAAAPG
jgi:tetratricopeptide (TPR) repeat protein